MHRRAEAGGGNCDEHINHFGSRVCWEIIFVCLLLVELSFFALNSWLTGGQLFTLACACDSRAAMLKVSANWQLAVALVACATAGGSRITASVR